MITNIIFHQRWNETENVSLLTRAFNKLFVRIIIITCGTPICVVIVVCTFIVLFSIVPKREDTLQLVPYNIKCGNKTYWKMCYHVQSCLYWYINYRLNLNRNVENTRVNSKSKVSSFWYNSLDFTLGFILHLSLREFWLKHLFKNSHYPIILEKVEIIIEKKW